MQVWFDAEFIISVPVYEQNVIYFFHYSFLRIVSNKVKMTIYTYMYIEK